MKVSGSIPLTQRLVEAAANALRDGHFVDPDDDTMPRFYETDQYPEGNVRHWTKPEVAAAPVVTALLRALAEEGHAIGPQRLEFWADSIERGETP